MAALESRSEPGHAALVSSIAAEAPSRDAVLESSGEAKHAALSSSKTASCVSNSSLGHADGNDSNNSCCDEGKKVDDVSNGCEWSRRFGVISEIAFLGITIDLEELVWIADGGCSVGRRGGDVGQT